MMLAQKIRRAAMDLAICQLRAEVRAAVAAAKERMRSAPASSMPVDAPLFGTRPRAPGRIPCAVVVLDMGKGGVQSLDVDRCGRSEPSDLTGTIERALLVYGPEDVVEVAMNDPILIVLGWVDIQLHDEEGNAVLFDRFN